MLFWASEPDLDVDGIAEPMELGHMPCKKGTYEDYVGRAGLERRGKKGAARRNGGVTSPTSRHASSRQPDDTMLGGGTVKKLDEPPAHCRAGDIANAFRLWRKECTLLHTRGRSKQRA